VSTEGNGHSHLQKDYVIIVVHGVGRQKPYQTLHEFVKGYAIASNGDRSITRASIASQLDRSKTENSDDGTNEDAENAKVFRIPGTNIEVTEYCYAPEFESHKDLVDASPTEIVATFIERLKQKHKERGTAINIRKGDDIAAKNLFSSFQAMLSCSVLITSTTKWLVDRISPLSDSAHTTIRHFPQQLELFVEHEGYRREVINGLVQKIEDIAKSSTHRGKDIVIAAHSLGSVVAILAILLMKVDPKKHDSLGRIKFLFTFGSPIDLFYVFFAELFDEVSDCREKFNQDLISPFINSGQTTGDATGLIKASEIDWTNYFLSNDPIASGLQVARKEVSTRNIFKENSPNEVFLGSGGNATAHTDYWTHPPMLRDMISVLQGRIPESKQEVKVEPTPPFIRLFHIAKVVLILMYSLIAHFFIKENISNSWIDRVAEDTYAYHSSVLKSNELYERDSMLKDLTDTRVRWLTANAISSAWGIFFILVWIGLPINRFSSCVLDFLMFLFMWLLFFVSGVYITRYQGYYLDTFRSKLLWIQGLVALPLLLAWFLSCIAIPRSRFSPLQVNIASFTIVIFFLVFFSAAIFDDSGSVVYSAASLILLFLIGLYWHAICSVGHYLTCFFSERYAIRTVARFWGGNCEPLAFRRPCSGE
jgi:hypothetical protein